MFVFEMARFLAAETEVRKGTNMFHKVTMNRGKFMLKLLHVSVDATRQADIYKTRMNKICH